MYNLFVVEKYYIPSLLGFTIIIVSIGVFLLRLYTELRHQLALVNKELDENEINYIEKYISSKRDHTLSKIGNSYINQAESGTTNLFVTERAMLGVKGKHYFINFIAYNTTASASQNIKTTIAVQKQIYESDVTDLEEISGVLPKSNIFVQSKLQRNTIAHIRIDKFCNGKFKLHFFTNKVVCIFLRSGSNNPQRYPQKTNMELKNNEVLTPFKLDLKTGDLLYFVDLKPISKPYISIALALLKQPDLSTKQKHEQMLSAFQKCETIDKQNNYSNISFIGIHI